MTFSKTIFSALSILGLTAAPSAWAQPRLTSRSPTLEVGGVTSGGAETEAKFFNLVPVRLHWTGAFNDPGSRGCRSWGVARTWVRPSEPNPSPTAGWNIGSRCLTPGSGNNGRALADDWNWIDSGTHVIRYPTVWARLEIAGHRVQPGDIFRESETSSEDQTERFPTLNRIAGNIASTLIRQFNPSRMATLTEYVRFLSWAAALPLPDFRMVPATEVATESQLDRYLMGLQTQQLAVQRTNHGTEVSRLGPYVNVNRLPSILFMQAMQSSADPIRVLLRQLAQAPAANRCETTNLMAVAEPLSQFIFYSDAQSAEWRQLRELSAGPDGTATLVIPSSEASELRREIFGLFGEIALSCMREGIAVPTEVLQLLGPAH